MQLEQLSALGRHWRSDGDWRDRSRIVWGASIYSAQFPHNSYPKALLAASRWIASVDDTMH